VTEAIATVLAAGTGGSELANRELIIGYDTRFMSEHFAAECAGEMARLGRKALLTTRRRRPDDFVGDPGAGSAGGSILLQATIPRQYNGMKFSTADGAPALPEQTREVEARIRELSAAGGDKRIAGNNGGSVVQFDPREDYLRDLEGKVDFRRISDGNLRLAYDPLWGQVGAILTKFFVGMGLKW
jgi:phosphoglucomutase